MFHDLSLSWVSQYLEQVSNVVMFSCVYSTVLAAVAALARRPQPDRTLANNTNHSTFSHSQNRVPVQLPPGSLHGRSLQPFALKAAKGLTWRCRPLAQSVEFLDPELLSDNRLHYPIRLNVKARFIKQSSGLQRYADVIMIIVQPNVKPDVLL